MNNNIAIVGAGISGLSVGKILQQKGLNPTIFERKSQPGGLVACSTVDGVLFHKVGGHVFNTKNPKVASWFWDIFNKEDFLQATRKAKIWLRNDYVGYPIENYLYQLKSDEVKSIVDELLACYKENRIADNFDDFLKFNFGETLYNLYFQPYNYKIWKTDLSQVALPWLEGKLPMPNVPTVLYSNIVKEQETNMVHSSFYYPKNGGSSFIAETIAKDQNIKYDVDLSKIKRIGQQWQIDDGLYDSVIFTGDVRLLHDIIDIDSTVIQEKLKAAQSFISHGTSNALCYVSESDLSWLYLPELNTEAHRIIYTGNFSPNNNSDSRLTCTVEFSGLKSENEMKEELKKMPFGLTPIAFNQEPNSYVIQDFGTKQIVKDLKDVLNINNFHLLGRFAEWEYYNMDKAIEAAMDLVSKKFNN